MNIRHFFLVILVSFTALLPQISSAISSAECFKNAGNGKWYYLTNQDEVDEDEVEFCFRILSGSVELARPSGTFGQLSAPVGRYLGQPSGNEPAPSGSEGAPSSKFGSTFKKFGSTFKKFWSTFSSGAYPGHEISPIPVNEPSPFPVNEPAPPEDEPAPIADDSIAGARDGSDVLLGEGISITTLGDISMTSVTIPREVVSINIYNFHSTREFVKEEIVIRQCNIGFAFVPCPDEP